MRDDLHDGLIGDFAGEGHHALAGGIANGEHSLHSGIGFSQDEEAHLSLSSCLVNTTPDTNLAIGLGGVEVLDRHVNFLESNFGVTLGSVQRKLAVSVSTGIVRILNELILLCFFLLTFLEALLFLRFSISFILGSGFFLGLLFGFLG